MTQHHICFAIATALVFLTSGFFFTPSARAQFGIGAGVAAMGDNVFEAGVNLANLVDGDSVQYGDIGGVVGGYAIAHFRYGYGSFTRLNLDASYVFFPSETVKISEVDQENNGAEFEVGATLIPVALGLELVLPSRTVRPYLGTQITYTVVNRTFAYVSGNKEFDREDIRTEWAGRDRWGLAFRTGCEFAVGNIALDLGLRYNMAALFHEADGGKKMNYLQVGASILFGDLIYTQEKDKADGH